MRRETLRIGTFPSSLLLGENGESDSRAFSSFFFILVLAIFVENIPIFDKVCALTNPVEGEGGVVNWNQAHCNF